MFEHRWHTMVAVVLAAGCNSVPARPESKNAPLAHSTAPPPYERPSPEGELAKLDRRAPVPLLPMMALHQKQSMREHLESVQAIVAAAAKADYAGVEEAARKMGYSEQMGQMCRHLGAGAAGFTEKALEFHHAADKIILAARERDMSAVLSKLGATLGVCTGCHATYRQQLVSELVGDHPPAGHR